MGEDDGMKCVHEFQTHVFNLNHTVPIDLEICYRCRKLKQDLEIASLQQQLTTAQDEIIRLRSALEKVANGTWYPARKIAQEVLTR